MKIVIELDKVAYDLLTGKIETANIDLFSTLIKSVKNGTPLEEELEKTITKEEVIQCRPEFLNPEQKGKKKYNQGWNEAIEHFINNIREFGEYDDIFQSDGE